MMPYDPVSLIIRNKLKFLALFISARKFWTDWFDELDSAQLYPTVLSCRIFLSKLKLSYCLNLKNYYAWHFTSNGQGEEFICPGLQVILISLSNYSRHVKIKFQEILSSTLHGVHIQTVYNVCYS